MSETNHQASHQPPKDLPFINHLRGSTRQMHDAIEKESFFFRMGKGEISEMEYKNYLRFLFAFNREIEATLERCPAALRQMADQVGFPLTRLIAQDLEHFKIKAEVHGGKDRLEKAMTLMKNSCAKDPRNILGFVYLIGGSQHGASFLAKALQKTGLLGEGFEGGFYLHGKNLPPLGARWGRFVQEVENFVKEDTALQASVVDAVKTGYEAMNQLGLGVTEQNPECR